MEDCGFAQVHFVGHCRYLRMMGLQDLVPVPSKLWPASHCLVPDDGEVGHAAEVLCDSNRVIHVEDNMPPPAGNKHSLPWSLENLQRFEFLGPGGFLCAGVDVLEPGDGLIPVLPTLPGLQLHQLL